MRLRTAILGGVALLVAAVMAAIVWSLSALVDRDAREDLASDLERSRQVFEELQEYRQSLFRQEIRVVAEEPRLKAVAATEEITHETVLGVAQELRRAIGSELFVITDGSGRLLADVADPDANGADLSGLPIIAQALARGESEGVWTDEGQAFQVQSKRLTFGTTTVGVLAVGHRLDDRVAQTARRQTGSVAMVLLDGKLVGGSSLERGRRAGATQIAMLAKLRLGAGGQVELELYGEQYLASAAKFPGYSGDRDLRYVVLRSLERAAALRRDLVERVYVVAALGLFLSMVLAVILSRRVARPVDRLVAFAGRVGAGQLEARATPDGMQEIDALAEAMNRMVLELERSRDERAHKERLEGELEIARRLQTSILPRRLDAPGLRVAAAMHPASEVGGDYYDLLPLPGGCWIGVGDVAGHGLSAGMVMLMVQCIVAALVRERPDAKPSELVMRLNDVLYENVRHRLQNDEHVTFSLLHYELGGKVAYAGAHEDIVVWRAAGRTCELIETPGTWLAAVPSIAKHTPDSELKLEVGDLMVLYTDGVTEASNQAGEYFGVEHLCAVVQDNAQRTVEEIRDAVLAAVAEWGVKQRDDVTLMVIRYEGETEGEGRPS